MTDQKPSWYEFFAGGGMARLGLGAEWQCVFSNEWSEKKATAYRTRFGAGNLRVCDVAQLTLNDLPGRPEMVWASFPCQDLSVAGSGAGLSGARSGTFHTFWRLMQDVIRQRRCPRLIVLENVVGTLTSHDGKDFKEIVVALSSEGYRVGAVVIDAVRFLPQSRPRLFFVAVKTDHHIPCDLTTLAPMGIWHTNALRTAVEKLPDPLRNEWLWWKLAEPSGVVKSLSDLLEEEPAGVRWHSKAETDRLLDLMSPLHLERLRFAQRLPGRIVGTVYRRTRPNTDGSRSQKAELRLDGISGCLRTPSGGSSRQTIIVVEGGSLRSRLLSSREAARLMGVPDDYAIPESYNDGYHLFGDGLAVPVVRWLNSQLLLPLSASGLRVAA